MSFNLVHTGAALNHSQDRLTRNLAGKSNSKCASICSVLLVVALLAVLTDCSHLKKEPWETAPLGRDQVEITRVGQQSNLRIERVRFFSVEMNEPRFFLALIPQTQSPPADVFILNHGWFDRPEYLLTYLKVDQVYGELLAQSKVRPAIVILPDVRFPNFYRVHSDRYPFPNYLTLVAEEVAKVVSQQYHIPFARDHWAIGGFSFGGYLSLDVARRYSGRFGSVSVVSGMSDAEWTYWPATPPPPGHLDAQGRGKQTVVVPGPVPRIFLACGTDDHLFGAMQALHDRLTQAGIPHIWTTAPGGHTWQYWSSVLRPMFEFHLAAASPEKKAAQ
jgi:enterochelin esterase-like enzyme